VNRWWPFLAAVAVILLDRGTKYLIEMKVTPWDVLPVIPGLFQIIHTRNTGIAFSMFADNQGEHGKWLLIVFSLAVLGLVGNLLWTACKPESQEHWTLRAALGLVMGGAMGNLYDRIIFGSVTDFLDFFWGHSHFPIFNLADSAITVGAGLLLINLWLIRRPAEKK
jgi:signal peptidase II